MHIWASYVCLIFHIRFPFSRGKGSCLKVSVVVFVYMLINVVDDI